MQAGEKNKAEDAKKKVNEINEKIAKLENDERKLAEELK